MEHIDMIWSMISNKARKEEPMIESSSIYETWVVYLAALLLLIFCVTYYHYDYKRRREMRRRRQEVRRANERLPQRRRPGAAHREHEIFRNVLKKVHEYIAQCDRVSNENWVVRQSRSVPILGRLLHAADNNNNTTANNNIAYNNNNNNDMPNNNH